MFEHFGSFRLHSRFIPTSLNLKPAWIEKLQTFVVTFRFNCIAYLKKVGKYACLLVFEMILQQTPVRKNAVYRTIKATRPFLYLKDYAAIPYYNFFQWQTLLPCFKGRSHDPLTASYHDLERTPRPTCGSSKGWQFLQLVQGLNTVMKTRHF